MTQTAHRLRPLLYGLLGLYLFIYPGSLVLVALDRVPVWGTWMGGAMLILLGTIMAVWMTANYGRFGALAALSILVLSWMVEHIGSITGFPFGSYTYTDVLQPKLFGVVPLAIPFAWLLVVPAAVGVTERVIERRGISEPTAMRMTLTKVLTAASFAVLLDVTIEPFAVHINNYWVWSYAGGYYGIPASNFVAWWVTSLLLAWVMLWFCDRASRQRVWTASGTDIVRGNAPALLAWVPIALYVLNLTMFVVVNLSHGQVAAAAIGSLIMIFLLFDWFEPVLVRWVFDVEAEPARAVREPES